MSARRGPMLGLKQFLQRAEVLSLYRQYLRATRPVPTLSARRETIAWFRDEFERTRHETQTDKVDSLLKHGRILLKQTESGFMLSGTGEPFVKLRGERT
ncbi:uncharacterized protein MJAP1_003435 [Malassezia japonica]|uniref:LYR motif-containing protein 2 n=1 Tax=Malassezia japonica TaxID=223818 RepID=A0AAF0F4K8_9BASI|nr:uncharacterized protein MJAP1_003435 [Malassezia japonica]WFD40449.1 hypothetical protein MJAP1_003435 [Malassezia japonica]